jgi:SAM-dependent methyltransferase
MDRTLYPDFDNNWDDSLFREFLLDMLKPTHYCLDYGAGRGNVQQMNFKGQVAFVAGVDPDPAVLNNPFVNEAKLLNTTNNSIPYPANTFDLVFSDNVMEHIQEPNVVLNEIRKVLKPGGVFVSKTPNSMHYMPVTARLTPTCFHRFYNGLRGRSPNDTFPTVYQFNSLRAVTRQAREAGLYVKDVRLIEGRPEYLRLCFLTYIAGYLYERLVNSMEALARFRGVLIFVLEKPAVPIERDA